MIATHAPPAATPLATPPALPSIAVGDRVESRDGYAIGTVAGIRPASADDSRSYVLVLRSRLFGLLKDTYLVPQGWVQKRAPDSRRVTLSASAAEVLSSPPLRQDAEIRADVAAALWPQGVSPQEAHLRISVTDGIVQLNGNTRNPRDTHGAVGRAWNVPGVLGVGGRLFDDETLTFAVAQALTQDPDTRRSHLLVRTRMGAVDLSGEVPSAATREMAAALGSAVPGVTSLFNGTSIRQALSS